MIKVFLDDKRNIPSDSWILFRDSASCNNYLKNNPIPDVISFDHDLGGEDTAMKTVHFLIDLLLDGKDFPPDFRFFVHSSNPEGAENIKSWMLGIYKEKTGNVYPHSIVRIQEGTQEMYLCD